jgi:hypothetical protein
MSNQAGERRSCLFLTLRYFEWVKKEDRGKSGTQELMKRNGGK